MRNTNFDELLNENANFERKEMIMEKFYDPDDSSRYDNYLAECEQKRKEQEERMATAEINKIRDQVATGIQQAINGLIDLSQREHKTRQFSNVGKAEDGLMHAKYRLKTSRYKKQGFSDFTAQARAAYEVLEEHNLPCMIIPGWSNTPKGQSQ